MTTDKKIEDYLHLYLGCEVEIKPDKEYKIVKISGKLIDNIKKDAWCKPILRPLNDMSEEEMKEMELLINQYLPEYEITENMRKEAMARVKKDGINAFVLDGDSPAMIFELTRLFLSKYFDLFGLIEAGIAIDKNSLK